MGEEKKTKTTPQNNQQNEIHTKQYTNTKHFKNSIFLSSHLSINNLNKIK